MTWHNYQLDLGGRIAGVLLDDRFAKDRPRILRDLGWFGVHCRMPSGNAFWDPDETVQLDAIEANLLRLSERASSGHAVYVRRVDTPGIREYYLYCAEGADLEAALAQLQILHPDYRLEYESNSDPEWTHYASWLRENAGA